MTDEEETPDETGESDDKDEAKMEKDETISLFDDSDDSPYVSKEVFLHIISSLNTAIVNLGTALSALDTKLKTITTREAISVRIRIAGQVEVFIRGDAKDKRWLMKSATEQTMSLIETLHLEDEMVREVEEIYDPSVG